MIPAFMAVCIIVNCTGPGENTDLEAGITNPPAGSVPRVWWHSMNGDISKGGIRADLEMMQYLLFSGRIPQKSQG